MLQLTKERMFVVAVEELGMEGLKKGEGKMRKRKGIECVSAKLP
jgi:hypothetical protein